MKEDFDMVTADISRALLPPTQSSKYCDVELVTPDNVVIRANRTLLAIRSEYFDKLFFSVFSESHISTVEIGIPSKLLQQIIEYCYTGICTFLQTKSESIQQLSAYHDEAVKDRVLQHVTELIELSKTADYCGLPRLQEDCADVLENVLLKFSFVACAVLEAVRMYGERCVMVSLTRLKEFVFISPEDHFMISDCRYGETGVVKGCLRDPFRGVMALSYESLRELVEVDRKGDEYMFQVVYFWATGEPIVMGSANTSSDGELGERLLTESRTALEAVVQKGKDELKMVQRKTVMHSDDKPDSDPHRRDTSAVRWEQARTLVRKLDLDSFDPLFVRNVVEGSELFDEEVLSDLFKRWAVRQQERIEEDGISNELENLRRV